MGYNFAIDVTCFWYVEAFNIAFICKVTEQQLFWRYILQIREKKKVPKELGFKVKNSLIVCFSQNTKINNLKSDFSFFTYNREK